MDEQTWQTQQFERHRARLNAVAYRMLGSVAEAEDAVQEVWLRINRLDSDAVANVGGWLTTVVARVCLDMLRTRRSRREEYAGSWLPEPIVTIDEDPGPEDAALMADSIGLALLVVLETLTPAERLAFVMHDMFDVPFDELAAVLDRSPAAARKLASRARQRVRGAAPPVAPDLARQREVVDAFLAASRAGDFDALVEVLHPDVVFRVDAGGRGPLAREPREGAETVAREVLARGTPFAPYARPAIVNGAAGVVVRRRGRLRAVVGFSVAGGRVTAIDLVLDPEKLQRLARSA